MRVNLNQAATSGVKPKRVIDAVKAFLEENNGVSVGRGADNLAATRAVFESRNVLAKFFGASNPANVIFTSGATESLNMAICGLVRDGCHVLATSLEHNAVARPLHLLEKQGRIELSWLACKRDGSFDPHIIHAAVRPNSRLLVMIHASNVIGNILPIEQAFTIARQYGMLTLLDAAQSAGHIEVMLNENTDAIAFAGHKGLRGLAGTGGLILGEKAANQIEVYKAGGTGSHSDSLGMPDFLPDKLEPGTHNMLGIISLKAAVEEIEAIGLERIRAHGQNLTTRFINGLRQLPVTVYGSYDESRWTPVVSVNAPNIDAGVLARLLGEDYGIDTRSGLHCSPLAHQAIGTFPGGTLRFSFGAGTTEAEIDYTLMALEKTISKQL